MAEDHGFNIASLRHSLVEMILAISRIQIQNRNQESPNQIIFSCGCRIYIYAFWQNTKVVILIGGDFFSCESLVNYSRVWIILYLMSLFFVNFCFFLISHLYFLLTLSKYSCLHSNIRYGFQFFTDSLMKSV